MIKRFQNLSISTIMDLKMKTALFLVITCFSKYGQSDVLSLASSIPQVQNMFENEFYRIDQCTHVLLGDVPG